MPTIPACPFSMWSALPSRTTMSKSDFQRVIVGLVVYSTSLPYPYGTPLDLSSSQYISLYMPRLDNSADSPQPCHIVLRFNGCFAWTSMALQTSSVRLCLSERYQHFRNTQFPMAYIILCVRFTYLVRWKKIQLRHRRNTRYGWVANPYPTGTCTLQDASSFAWRTNALLIGKFCWVNFCLRSRIAKSDTVKFVLI